MAMEPGGWASSFRPHQAPGKVSRAMGGVMWAVTSLGWCRQCPPGAKRTCVTKWRFLPQVMVQERKHSKETGMVSSFLYLLPETNCVNQVSIRPVEASRDTSADASLFWKPSCFPLPHAYFFLCAGKKHLFPTSLELSLSQRSQVEGQG